MRDLPRELPMSEWPPLDVDRKVFSVLYFGWKRGGPDDPGTEPGMIRWFAPDGTRVAQYDEESDTIYLSVELAEPGNEDQLVISLGHERYHAKQYRFGHLFTCLAAEGAGERLLKAWTAEQAAWDDLRAWAVLFECRATLARAQTRLKQSAPFIARLHR
jgi:hypothetical protein